MIIPRQEPERSRHVRYVVDVCTESQNDRAVLYDYRRRFFLFGSYERERVLYNRLMAHTDLVASFLYAADHCRFTVAAPRNADRDVVAQMLAVEEEWNDTFLDSGVAYEFVTALQWAICYDSVFMKMGWNDARDQLFAKIVQPHDFGVFDESVADLDSQEAFVHSYSLDWDNAVQRLLRAGLRDQVKKLQTSPSPAESVMPPVLANMMITSTSGANMGGPVTGSINQNYAPTADYVARSSAPKIRFHEVWMWDDQAEDYVIIALCEPDIVVSDSRETMDAFKKIAKKRGPKPLYASATNIFLPEDHPFVHICPFRLPDYFWGECHTDRLTPLQMWTNTRLNQIHEILEMQVDPAKVFSGFMGLTDEKAGALGGPGSWVVDQLPGAKVDRLLPEMPPDLFAELQSIGHLFLEASGLTETVTGKGEQGVRGRGHAKQLATTGSARIRKVAVGLEQPLVKLGETGLKLKQKNDATRLKTDTGMEFVLSQVAAPWKMRVAGHSHSPLFADESRELAVILLKAQAIDQEMFIRLLHPPGEANMIHTLRARNKVKAEMAAKGLLPEQQKAKGKGKPNGMGAPAG